MPHNFPLWAEKGVVCSVLLKKNVLKYRAHDFLSSLIVQVTGGRYYHSLARMKLRKIIQPAFARGQTVPQCLAWTKIQIFRLVVQCSQEEQSYCLSVLCHPQKLILSQFALSTLLCQMWCSFYRNSDFPLISKELTTKEIILFLAQTSLDNWMLNTHSLFTNLCWNVCFFSPSFEVRGKLEKERVIGRQRKINRSNGKGKGIRLIYKGRQK